MEGLLADSVLRNLANWREGAGSIVDRHMFQHVGRRLKGRLTNLVHADRVPAVTTYHKSAAHNPSGRCVHALSLRFDRDVRGDSTSNRRLWSLPV